MQELRQFYYYLPDNTSGGCFWICWTADVFKKHKISVVAFWCSYENKNNNNNVCLSFYLFIIKFIYFEYLAFFFENKQKLFNITILTISLSGITLTGWHIYFWNHSYCEQQMSNIPTQRINAAVTMH